MQLVDSHCHLDFPDFRGKIDEYVKEMRTNEVAAALCVAVNLEDLPGVLSLARQHENLYASVGVHPGYSDYAEPSVEQLVSLAAAPKVVAIGETGLDYFRDESPETMARQQERFRVHIQAAITSRKPLIIHTRAASADTIRLMREEGASRCGAVMHCFTESAEMAKECLDLGLYISFSGIVTFKNAAKLRDVAATVPDDRLLVETDSPYLAPAPHRGETNRPALVRHVAKALADIRGVSLERIAELTTNNFERLFAVSLSSNVA
jgi:TatD DNase family protein